jgi:hypothetical protein
MRGYVVAVYELGQSYGGPEEGGWWYDTGELVRVLRAFKDLEKACDYARRVNRSLHFKAESNPHIRPLHSVAYDGGRFCAEIHDGTAPESYPLRRPHYE